MSDEVTHNHVSGLNLYVCRFQQNGDVFLTDGASDEVWGTGGRDAADYDVAMTEEANSGHYKCDFDAGSNIGAGVYQVTVYVRDGANPPANGDVILAQGEIYWNGTNELNASTITALITVADIHNAVIEGGITHVQALRLFLAVLTGVSGGGGSLTLTFKDIGGTKDRIIATVDRDGNRTNVVRDGT